METNKERCPNGERKNPKTGKCEKMSSALRKHKQTLRNKKKPAAAKGSVKKSSSPSVPSPKEQIISILSDEPIITKPIITKKLSKKIKQNKIKQNKTVKTKSHSTISEIVESIISLPIVDETVDKRCPNGERKNPKTGK